MNAETPTTDWFDAHLDLAMLQVQGRDMDADPAHAGGTYPPTAITLPSLREGGVRRCLATIFTEANGTDPRLGYPAGDGNAAFVVGTRQLQLYRQWAATLRCELVTAKVPLPPGGQRAGVARSSPRTGDEAGVSSTGALRMGILIEGADIIREPEELGWWARQGVIAVGMAWWAPSRYSAGNGTPPSDPVPGLTDLGRALARQIDRLGLVHDLSHLSDLAADEVLATTTGRIMASHSNCRALMGDPSNQRHLTDGQIKAIGARGGVVGINLYSRFLDPACDREGRTTIARTIAHIEHVCSLTGSHRHVGLGTDADGGFSGARLPESINAPKDYHRLTDALAARGWSDEQLAAFQRENFLRLMPELG